MGPGPCWASICAPRTSPASEPGVERKYVLDAGRPPGPRPARAGAVHPALVRREGLEPARVSKAFGNDIFLALSCREAGPVLVTDNRRDFERIARLVRFDFVDPWPTPASR
jgi:hypothetical protein